MKTVLIAEDQETNDFYLEEDISMVRRGYFVVQIEEELFDRYKKFEKEKESLFKELSLVYDSINK